MAVRYVFVHYVALRKMYKGGKTPSSGLIAVFLLLQVIQVFFLHFFQIGKTKMCDELDLYGFGHSNSSKARYHYYNGVGHRTVGSSVHNWK